MDVISRLSLTLSPPFEMSDAIHIAITRRIREEHAPEFERLLAEFASRSLTVPGLQGVQIFYPPPGPGPREYGILRSFASEAEKDEFYQSDFYRQWENRVKPLTDGELSFRKLDGLEAFFRNTDEHMPPRWKMALLTWIAVWPVSMVVPMLLLPLIGQGMPSIMTSGIISAGIVIILTWVAMPLLVKAAHSWLHPKPTSTKHP